MLYCPSGFCNRNLPENTREQKRRALKKLALEVKLVYGTHPVLSWMVDNIHVRTDPAGNIKPNKQKSTEKIDGVVATIMALDRAIRNGTGHVNNSVYDERGLLFV
nr:terminase TerL endonuclease subunit [Arcanobacterium buesumense]